VVGKKSQNPILQGWPGTTLGSAKHTCEKLPHGEALLTSRFPEARLNAAFDPRKVAQLRSNLCKHLCLKQRTEHQFLFHKHAPPRGSTEDSSRFRKARLKETTSPLRPICGKSAPHKSPARATSWTPLASSAL
jgi:hypothetical protein